MREDIAQRLGLDSRPPTFINNHAWSLVDLQAQGLIKKVAHATYALADASTVTSQQAYDSAVTKRQAAVSKQRGKADDKGIHPPLIGAMPPWARNLIRAANARNAKMFFSTIRLTDDDLLALWNRCGGVCALSGLSFSGERIGTGKAQRPFFPSLDRIDPEQPYSFDNCRLVLQAVNFALNSYGDEVFLKIARATARTHFGD